MSSCSEITCSEIVSNIFTLSCGDFIHWIQTNLISPLHPVSKTMPLLKFMCVLYGYEEVCRFMTDPQNTTIVYQDYIREYYYSKSINYCINYLCLSET